MFFGTHKYESVTNGILLQIEVEQICPFIVSEKSMISYWDKSQVVSASR